MQRRPDSAQLRRQWALLRLLSSAGRWYTVKELANQLDCSKSTIERDLATLEAVFPLVEERVGKQKRKYRIDTRSPELEIAPSFGLMQLAALSAALQALRPLAGTPLYNDLRGLAHVVRGALADRHNGDIDRVHSVFLPHARGYVPYAAHAEIIDELVDAIAKRRACRVRYCRAGETDAAERLIHPLRLLWHDAALYLLCRFTTRGCVGKLAVHRIVAIEQTATTYTPPRDLVEMTRRAFGIYHDDGPSQEVEIHFSARIAWLLDERIFHPDELKDRLASGGIRYRIRSTAMHEIVRWVLQFGGDAVLVSPASWRDELVRQAQRLLAAHADR